MSAVTGGEHQAYAQAPPALRPVPEQAHPAVVHLQLLARLAVRHPHRRPRPAELQLRRAEPVQRPVRHQHAAPGQQIVDLGQPQATVQFLLQELPLPLQPLPCLTVQVARPP